jgi:hypothetical protein
MANSGVAQQAAPSAGGAFSARYLDTNSYWFWEKGVDCKGSALKFKAGLDPFRKRKPGESMRGRGLVKRKHGAATYTLVTTDDGTYEDAERMSPYSQIDLAYAMQNQWPVANGKPVALSELESHLSQTDVVALTPLLEAAFPGKLRASVPKTPRQLAKAFKAMTETGKIAAPLPTGNRMIFPAIGGPLGIGARLAHFSLNGLDDQLHVNRKKRSSIFAGGACLFGGIAAALYNNQGYHQLVRDAVCDSMLAQPEKYGPFMEDGKELIEYVAVMRREGVFGGKPELVASAALYSKQITVIKPVLNGYEKCQSYGDEHAGNGTIELAFVPAPESELSVLNHFDRVIDVDGSGPLLSTKPGVKEASVLLALARAAEHKREEELAATARRREEEGEEEEAEAEAEDDEEEEGEAASLRPKEVEELAAAARQEHEVLAPALRREEEEEEEEEEAAKAEAEGLAAALRQEEEAVELRREEAHALWRADLVARWREKAAALAARQASVLAEQVLAQHHANAAWQVNVTAHSTALSSQALAAASGPLSGSAPFSVIELAATHGGELVFVPTYNSEKDLPAPPMVVVAAVNSLDVTRGNRKRNSFEPRYPEEIARFVATSINISMGKDIFKNACSKVFASGYGNDAFEKGAHAGAAAISTAVGVRLNRGIQELRLGSGLSERKFGLIGQALSYETNSERDERGVVSVDRRKPRDKLSSFISVVSSAVEFGRTRVGGYSRHGD